MESIQELDLQLALARINAFARANELQVYANIHSLLSNNAVLPAGWAIERIGSSYQLTIGEQVVWKGSDNTVDIFREDLWLKEVQCTIGG